MMLGALLRSWQWLRLCCWLALGVSRCAPRLTLRLMRRATGLALLLLLLLLPTSLMFTSGTVSASVPPTTTTEPPSTTTTLPPTVSNDLTTDQCAPPSSLTLDQWAACQTAANVDHMRAEFGTLLWFHLVVSTGLFVLMMMRGR